MGRRHRVVRHQRGASSVEYALLLALVVVFSVPAIQWLHDSSEAEFQGRAASAGSPDLSAVATTTTTTVPTTTAPAPTTTTSVAINATASLTATANRQGNTWSATATATVVDQNNQPVQGVVVTGAWSPAISGETSCTTDSNGQCSMTQAGMEARDNKPFVANVTFSVSSVSKVSDPNFSYQQSPMPSIGPIPRPT